MRCLSILDDLEYILWFHWVLIVPICSYIRGSDLTASSPLPTTILHIPAPNHLVQSGTPVDEVDRYSLPYSSGFVVAEFLLSLEEKLQW